MARPVQAESYLLTIQLERGTQEKNASLRMLRDSNTSTGDSSDRECVERTMSEERKKYFLRND